LPKVIEEVNKEIRNLLVESRLTGGLAPWQQPWVVIPKRNYDTGRQYNGINRVLLANDPEISYITHASAKKHGGEIIEGAKARIIVVWAPPSLKKVEKEKLDKGQISEGEAKQILRKRRPFSTLHYVFRSKDITGLETKTYEDDKKNKRFSTIEDFLSSLKQKGLKIEEGGNKAFYNEHDTVLIPRIEQFDSPENYYRALFHEIAHWTGNENRLKRGDKFDSSQEYGKEELIAEIAAGYLCQYFDISITENSVRYIDNWLTAINGDAFLVISAGQQAEKVLKYLEVD